MFYLCSTKQKQMNTKKIALNIMKASCMIREMQIATNQMNGVQSMRLAYNMALLKMKIKSATK